MKVNVSGIDNEKKENPEMEINQKILMLLNHFEGLSNFNESIKMKIISSLRYEFVDAWEYIKQMKTKSAFYFQLYYQLKSIFDDKSISLLMTRKINNEIFSSGLFGGQVYTISAPSGKGKTAFCTMLVTTLIAGDNPFLKMKKEESGKRVLYITLEQTAEEIEARVISTLSAFIDLKKAIKYSDILSKSQRLNDSNYLLAVQYFSLIRENIKILSTDDFQQGLSIESIAEKIRHLDFCYDVIVIDQFDNIEGIDFVNMDIPILIKALAQELNTPIILQAQLNKSSISNALTINGQIDARKITGNSLKGTSALEHQSSMVLTLVPKNESKEICGHHAEKIVCQTVKNRYGSTARIDLWFLGGFNLYFDENEIAQLKDATVDEVEEL